MKLLQGEFDGIFSFPLSCRLGRSGFTLRREFQEDSTQLKTKLEEVGKAVQEEKSTEQPKSLTLN